MMTDRPTTWSEAMKNLFVAGTKFVLVAIATLIILILWLSGNLGVFPCR